MRSVTSCLAVFPGQHCALLNCGPQDTDKTVRVECAFTAEDQTVSFRPTAGPDGREDGGGISVT
jgi:hypothetical protein